VEQWVEARLAETYLSGEMVLARRVAYLDL
jgi:hypothetical protein